MKNSNQTNEDVKKVLIEFFKKNRYRFWKDFDSHNLNPNRISLQFVTADDNEEADIRILQFLPKIEGWSYSIDENEQGFDLIYIELVKNKLSLYKRLFSKN